MPSPLTSDGKIDLGYDSRLGPTGIKNVRYSTETFDFAGKIAAHMVARGFLDAPVPLELVHRHVPADTTSVDEHWLNELSRACYALDEDAAWMDMYRRFLKEVVLPALGFDVIFQGTPTVRFHCPGPFPASAKTPEGRLIGYHSDTMLGHPFEEINVWLPVTDTFGTNALVLSNLEDGRGILEAFLETIDHDPDVYFTEGRQMSMAMIRDDPTYQRRCVESCPPYPMSYGEVLMFDPRCVHGADENRESMTRVSLDFRLIPVDAEAEMTREYRGTGRSKRTFARGDAFHAVSAGDL